MTNLGFSEYNVKRTNKNVYKDALLTFISPNWFGQIKRTLVMSPISVNDKDFIIMSFMYQSICFIFTCTYYYCNLINNQHFTLSRRGRAPAVFIMHL